MAHTAPRVVAWCAEASSRCTRVGAPWFPPSHPGEFSCGQPNSRVTDAGSGRGREGMGNTQCAMLVFACPGRCFGPPPSLATAVGLAYLGRGSACEPGASALRVFGRRGPFAGWHKSTCSRAALAHGVPGQLYGLPGGMAVQNPSGALCWGVAVRAYTIPFLGASFWVARSGWVP